MVNVVPAARLKSVAPKRMVVLLFEMLKFVATLAVAGNSVARMVPPLVRALEAVWIWANASDPGPPMTVVSPMIATRGRNVLRPSATPLLRTRIKIARIRQVTWLWFTGSSFVQALNARETRHIKSAELALR